MKGLLAAAAIALMGAGATMQSAGMARALQRSSNGERMVPSGPGGYRNRTGSHKQNRRKLLAARRRRC